MRRFGIIRRFKERGETLLRTISFAVISEDEPQEDWLKEHLRYEDDQILYEGELHLTERSELMFKALLSVDYAMNPGPTLRGYSFSQFLLIDFLELGFFAGQASTTNPAPISTR